MTHTCRSKVTPLVAGMLLLGGTATTPGERASSTLGKIFTRETLQDRRIMGTIIFFAAFHRMVMNAEKGETAETTKKRFVKHAETLTNYKKALSLDYLKTIGACCLNILDNVIIGSPGKKRSIKAFGSKIVMDGDPEFGDVEIGPDGEEIKLRRYNDRMPYGIMGTLWGCYIQPVIYHLKDLKELAGAVNFIGNEINIDVKS